MAKTSKLMAGEERLDQWNELLTPPHIQLHVLGTFTAAASLLSQGCHEDPSMLSKDGYIVPLKSRYFAQHS